MREGVLLIYMEKKRSIGSSHCLNAVQCND